MTQSTQMMEELDDCFVKTAANIMKYYVNEEERKKIIQKLRNTLEKNCVESEKMIAANNIKRGLEVELHKNIEEIVKDYKKAISEIQIDVSENNRLLDFDRQIEDLRKVHEGTSGGTSGHKLDDTDTDLRLTNTDINVIDPISKTRMTNPVKNAVCGHVYDKNSLVAMLQKNKKTRCPVVGCTSISYIDLKQCRTDIVTKMYLEKNPA